MNKEAELKLHGQISSCDLQNTFLSALKCSLRAESHCLIFPSPCLTLNLNNLNKLLVIWAAEWKIYLIIRLNR